MLGDAGYSAKIALSGGDALRLIPIVQPDVMLLDILSDHFDGRYHWQHGAQR